RGQCGRGTMQVQIVQPHSIEEFEPVSYSPNDTSGNNLFARAKLQVREELEGIGNGPGHDFRYRPIDHANGKTLRFESGAVTGSTQAGHHDVGQNIRRKQGLSLVVGQKVNNPFEVLPTVFDAVEDRCLDL